ncbi:MAG: hypothetical protein M0Z85_08930 [Gammaproteobacteria bacterium]|nr:hypothetical protein [Gammaproteobacteria bacterium]
MFKDFDGTKKQLAELAEIVNKFKSEAVQLKLLELLFDTTPQNIDEDAKSSKSSMSKKGARRKKTTPQTSTSSDNENKGSKKPSSFGPATILKKLYDEEFFSEPRTISDICQHSEISFAKKIKSNEISGRLGRMVRDGELVRRKNSDNQYAYTKS